MTSLRTDHAMCAAECGESEDVDQTPTPTPQSEQTPEQTPTPQPEPTPTPQSLPTPPSQPGEEASPLSSEVASESHSPSKGLATIVGLLCLATAAKQIGLA